MFALASNSRLLIADLLFQTFNSILQIQIVIGRCVALTWASPPVIASPATVANLTEECAKVSFFQIDIFEQIVFNLNF